MSANRYFNNLYIPPKSPLIDYLGIPSGYYSGQYDTQKEELILKSNSPSKEKKNKIFSGSVTLEQLLVILTLVQRDRGDKFTPDEIEIIKKIKKPTPENFRGSRLFPAHHIIPKDVCQNSNFIVQATKLTEFHVNHGINRLQLPSYFHPSAHKDYSDFVEGILEDEWRELVKNAQENDGEAIWAILEGAIAYFRDTIEEMRKSGAVSSINDVFPKWD